MSTFVDPLSNVSPSTPLDGAAITEAERRLTTIPWASLDGLGSLLDVPLTEVLNGQSAERVLDRFLRAHKDFTAIQRTVCAESIFGVGLWRRRLRWHCDGNAVQLLAVLAGHLGGYADAARVLQVSLPSLRPTPSLFQERFSFPDWVAQHLQTRFGNRSSTGSRSIQPTWAHLFASPWFKRRIATRTGRSRH